MPRVNVVQKARKSQGACSKCQTKIKKGDPYKWIKPRYGMRRVVCGKCQFKSSDLTSSDKLSQVYSAQEDCEAAIQGWDGSNGTVDDLKDALTTAAGSIREVGEGYQESADNIHQTFSESSTADDCEEKANSLESWADEFESAADDLEEFDEQEAEREAEADFDPKSQGDKQAFIDDGVDKKREEWAEEQRSKAEEPCGNCPV